MTRYIIALIFTALLSGAGEAAELRLKFPALKSGGQVVYAVFDSKATWDARSPARLGGRTPAGRNEVLLDLPPGAYAVMAYHDRNGDERLNTLPVGLPTEPYGFSNNSRAMFGPPGWNDAMFKLEERGAVQTIRLR